MLELVYVSRLSDLVGFLFSFLKIAHFEKRNILTPPERDNSARSTARTKRTRSGGVSEFQIVIGMDEYAFLRMAYGLKFRLSDSNLPKTVSH